MTWTPTWSHETTLAGDLRSAAEAREFVRGHLDGHQLSGLVDDVRLVASELATNAVVHAQTPFTITLEGDERSTLLTVRDGSTVLPIQLAAQVLDSSGRGLVILEQLAQRWGVTTDTGGTKSVWAWFDAPSHDPLPTTW